MDRIKISMAIALAAVLWLLMFSPWTAPHFPFWYTMLAATGILTALALWWGHALRHTHRVSLSDVALGIGSAALLWGVFYVGNELSQVLFPFSPGQISNIHAMKDGQSRLFVGLALLLWIGPAEEIFWRGYIQRYMESRWGRWTGYIITTLIYALVHIWAFNFMLIMAALVCGAFWGLIYTRTKNLALVAISHAVWDAVIFVLLPIG